MTLILDLSLDLSQFSNETIDPDTVKLNKDILKDTASAPNWWMYVGPDEYRRLTTRAVLNSSSGCYEGVDKQTILIPSRERGRNIECRLVKPMSGIAKGIFLHIHGGGWVLGSPDLQDVLLDHITQDTGLVVISVGYRLAPEHPYPAGEEDIYDVAEYLVDHAVTEYNLELKFVGGESAGSQLSIQTILHLLETRPNFSFKGTVLNYGGYDMNLLPSGRSFITPVFLTAANMDHFVYAYLPGRSAAARRSPAVSPIYHPIFQHFGGPPCLVKKRLPPAIFLVGTQDAVLDDTILMGAKWLIAGGKAVIKFIANAPHGFMTLDPRKFKVTAEGSAYIMEFLVERLQKNDIDG